MFTKIDHIGIAVKSLEVSVKTYTTLTGLKASPPEEVEEQKTRVSFLPVGESRLELLEAMDPDSPIAKYIGRRGEGIHHICFQVENLTAALQKLKAAGVRLVDETPRRGAGNCLVAFIHPSSANGVLLELTQKLQPASQGKESEESYGNS